MQADYALRLQTWVSDTQEATPRPRFISAVATALDAESVALTLAANRPAAAVATFSDDTARSARDLELVLDEGPIGDATAIGAPVHATDDVITDYWKWYGPAVTRLGVRTVTAVPLRAPTACSGALCVYQEAPVAERVAVSTTRTIADAIAHAVLSPADATPVDGPLDLFTDVDHRTVVHRAAALLASIHDCGIGDATALLRARAFADEISLDEVSIRVVDGSITL